MSKAYKFFTDLGEDITLVNEATNEKVHIGRYGYWLNLLGANRIVVNSGDLDMLREMYGDLPVFRIEQKKLEK